MSFEQNRHNQIHYARVGSGLAAARLFGMKMRAGQATSTTEHMPFAGHKTCAQWKGPNQRGKRALKARD